MKQVLKGFLSREPHLRLGCGEFSIDPDEEILVEPTRDPGVYGKAHELLKPYVDSHHRAVVILDEDWGGSPRAVAIRAAHRRAYGGNMERVRGNRHRTRA